MLCRDEVLNLVLLYQFTLPVELRFIICENYFPFLPNEELCLNLQEVNKAQRFVKSFDWDFHFIHYKDLVFMLNYYSHGLKKIVVCVVRQNAIILREILDILPESNIDLSISMVVEILRKYRKRVLSLIDFL